MMHSNVQTSLLSFLLVLSTAFAVQTYPEDKFDHQYDLTTGGGTQNCSLLSLVVDESGSMMYEHDFLQNSAVPMLVSELKAKNYDHIFICSHGFGSARDSREDGDGFAFHGCTDAMAWDATPTSEQLGSVMGTWRTLGGVEDPYLGTLMGIENTPGVIDGYQLNQTCGTMFKNMILLTDEDRDVFNSNTITKGDVTSQLQTDGFVFNAIINVDISSAPDRENFEGLGFFPSDDQPGKYEFFVPDGSNLGTYTTLYKDQYLTYLDPGQEGGNSIDDYVSISVDTLGAVYDLGMLRLEDADYTSAFVNSLSDTQVKEISVVRGTASELTETPPTEVPPQETPQFEDTPQETPQTEEETPAEPGDNPPVEDTGGSVLGDPHFKTWQNEHYEFHGQCDMVLVKDPNFANGLGLDIHIRAKLVRYWSYIQSVAIRIGNDILELQGSADPEDYQFHYWVNYEYQADNIDTLGGFPMKGYSKKVHSHKNKFEIDLSSAFGIENGPKILISSFKEFLKVEFENQSEQAFGKTVGLLGEYSTGKTLARDGSTVINDWTDLGQEWQVLPADGRLFHENSEPQFPELCIEPEDPRGDRRRRLAESKISEEEAEAACASLKDPIYRKDCVYDILATQDIEMVGAF